MAHAIRKNQIVALGVQRTAWIEECLGECRAQKDPAVSAGPMQHKDGIVDLALGISMGRTQGRITNLHTLQRPPVSESAILEPGIGLNGICIDPLVSS